MSQDHDVAVTAQSRWC